MIRFLKKTSIGVDPFFYPPGFFTGFKFCEKPFPPENSSLWRHSVYRFLIHNFLL